MASSPPPIWMTGELDQPDSEAAIVRGFAAYRVALSRMTVDQQMGELTRINALLQQQALETQRSMIRSDSESTSAIDRLVPRMTPLPSTAGHSSRGQDAQASSRSQQPDPSRFRSSPKGRALAEKLVASGARIGSRRTR